MKMLLALAIATAAFTAGCQKAPQAPADSHAGHGHATSDSAHTAGADAAAGGAPSSQAMCGEHGVLESMCTRCNAGLVPAYQAKGDFCAEHQLPESVCPQCHPERGGRPVEASALPGDGPLDRTVLTFRSLASARDAGLRVAAAEAGRDPAGVTGTATVVVDAAHRALVNAPAAGVVRAVTADVGTHVAAGAPLARIESAVVAEAHAQRNAARARFDAGRAAFVRESTLHRSDLSSAQAEQSARQEMEAARAAVASADAALRMYGAERAGGGGEYLLRSPIAGVVTRRTVALGAMVDTEAPLFEVVDPTALWADIDVPETQSSYVRTGQRVVLRARELPGREVGGTVEFVSPAVDEHTRTLRVRARLDAADTRGLRANSWAEAVIRTGSSERTVLVPRAALQESGGAMVAFVRLAEDRYEVRRVQVGAADGDRVAVHAGLSGGEMVVTTGSFLLKTETLKESIGAGCCDVEAPKRR